MSNTLDLTCDRGDDFFLDFTLEAAGVDFTGYVVRIVVAESIGLTPVINVASSDAGQTAITIDLSAGLGCAIALTKAQTLFPFEVGKYSVSMQSPAGVKETLMRGSLMVLDSAGELL